MQSRLPSLEMSKEFLLSMKMMAAINVHYCGGKRMQVSTHIWSIEQWMLHILETSASLEQVFSAAAEIINKKRARLTPENANLLIFLKENQNFTEWE